MYDAKGRFSRQAHVDIPEGLFEEEYARKGFFGRTSHLYREQPPVDWVAIEGDLKPYAINALAMAKSSSGGDYIHQRLPFLYNNDCTLAIAKLTEAMPYYFRNADGDDILFVHRGAGEIETDFGPLQYERGDYLVIPRGTVYRLNPSVETSLLIIESYHEVELPDRGPLGKHAFFDPGIINTPTPEKTSRSVVGQQYELKIKRDNQVTTVVYPRNPINVVGWKGELTVWQLNVRDMRPITSERYHLPPPVHTTFLMRNVIVCSFLPRPLENGDPKAMKVPFYHNNIDFDEVIFYHDGNFFSREGIDAGMVTFHPQGIHHGPHPKAVDASKNKERTDEQAVMIDSRFPLKMTELAKQNTWADYWKSWQ